MDFNSISLGANEPNACTPDLPEEFVGVRINMPQTVDLEKDKFAVCGTYRFVPEYVYSFDYIHHAIVLVIIDATFHRPRASNLQPPVRSFSRPQSEGFKRPEGVSNVLLQRYFNVDVRMFFPSIPKTPAQYFVYTMIEKHVSNVCSVEVIAPGGSNES